MILVKEVINEYYQLLVATALNIWLDITISGEHAIQSFQIGEMDVYR
jgi:hypothetical protein